MSDSTVGPRVVGRWGEGDISAELLDTGQVRLRAWSAATYSNLKAFGRRLIEVGELFVENLDAPINSKTCLWSYRPPDTGEDVRAAMRKSKETYAREKKETPCQD